MIVVVGNPVARASGAGGGLAGAPALTAVAAARAGAAVQLVGKAGEDRAGNDLMLALARADVGHVALLRDPAHSTPIAAEASARDAPEEAHGPSALGTDDEPDELVSVIPADPSDRPTLDAADVQLALRYLPDYTTLVVAEPQPEAVVTTAAEAAAWAGATLVLVVDAGTRGPATPPSAIVFEAPAADPDGAFATMLGELAAAIDRGESVEAAFRGVEGRLGLSPAVD